MKRISKEALEARLSGGESLRGVAASLGITHQTLQQYRRNWGCKLLRPSWGKRGGDNHAWKGGSFIDWRGYKMVLAPERGKNNKYCPEHILVAEEKIGRQLRPNEHVHHINGIKTDNEPDNLLVCTKSKHRLLHRQLEEIGYELLRRNIITFVRGRYLLS